MVAELSFPETFGNLGGPYDTPRFPRCGSFLADFHANLRGICRMVVMALTTILMIFCAHIRIHFRLMCLRMSTP